MSLINVCVKRIQTVKFKIKWSDQHRPGEDIII